MHGKINEPGVEIKTLKTDYILDVLYCIVFIKSLTFVWCAQVCSLAKSANCGVLGQTLCTLHFSKAQQLSPGQATSQSHVNMLQACWLCADVGALLARDLLSWLQAVTFLLSLLFVSCSAPCVVIWVCTSVYLSLCVYNRHCADLFCRYLSSPFLSLFHALILSFLLLSFTPPRQPKLVWQDLKPPLSLLPFLSLSVPHYLQLHSSVCRR